MYEYYVSRKIRYVILGHTNNATGQNAPAVIRRDRFVVHNSDSKQLSYYKPVNITFRIYKQTSIL